MEKYLKIISTKIANFLVFNQNILVFEIFPMNEKNVCVTKINDGSAYINSFYDLFVSHDWFFQLVSLNPNTYQGAFSTNISE